MADLSIPKTYAEARDLAVRASRSAKSAAASLTRTRSELAEVEGLIVGAAASARGAAIAIGTGALAARLDKSGAPVDVMGRQMPRSAALGLVGLAGAAVVSDPTAAAVLHDVGVAGVASASYAASLLAG